MIYAIDFDDTLNFSSLGDKFNPNYKLISFLRDKNFFILTARDGTDSNKNYINDFLELNLLFPNKVIFTNKASKGPFLKEEAADHLVDDNAEQRGSAEEYGVKATHPKDLEDLIFSKAEVEVSKKEARKKYFCSLLKETKDSKTKARLCRAFKYAEERKKKSKKKTEKMKKESRKKRISFFRSNLDYGKEKFKKIEDKAEDHNDLTKSKKISNLLSFLPSEILQEKEEFNEEEGEEGIFVKNVPMTSLSMVKEQADRVLRDIRRGELSMTAGLPVLFYNAREQQLIVDDGNHRIFQRWLSGEDYFDAYIYSGSYHNYLRHVYDGEEKFNWNMKRPL